MSVERIDYTTEEEYQQALNQEQMEEYYQEVKRSLDYDSNVEPVKNMLNDNDLPF